MRGGVSGVKFAQVVCRVHVRVDPGHLNDKGPDLTRNPLTFRTWE